MPFCDTRDERNTRNARGRRIKKADAREILKEHKNRGAEQGYTTAR